VQTEDLLNQVETDDVLDQVETEAALEHVVQPEILPPSRVVCFGRPTKSDAKKKRSMNDILGIKPNTSKSKPKKKSKAKNK
jgi:hypothetical protein